MKTITVKNQMDTSVKKREEGQVFMLIILNSFMVFIFIFQELLSLGRVTKNEVDFTL